jgi:hypothetical protein
MDSAENSKMFRYLQVDQKGFSSIDARGHQAGLGKFRYLQVDQKGFSSIDARGHQAGLGNPPIKRCICVKNGIR